MYILKLIFFTKKSINVKITNFFIIFSDAFYTKKIIFIIESSMVAKMKGIFLMIINY